MAPDQTPPDAWSSLTCILPDCHAELAVVWKLYAPLVHGELEPDADPLAPGDAVAGEWRVECLLGHVILVPGPVDECDDQDTGCATGMCDHDDDEGLRTWRRTDVDRLTALIDPRHVIEFRRPVPGRPEDRDPVGRRRPDRQHPDPGRPQPVPGERRAHRAERGRR